MAAASTPTTLKGKYLFYFLLAQLISQLAMQLVVPHSSSVKESEKLDQLITDVAEIKKVLNVIPVNTQRIEALEKKSSEQDAKCERRFNDALAEVTDLRKEFFTQLIHK